LAGLKDDRNAARRVHQLCARGQGHGRRRLRHTLEQAGIRCWIAPRDITPGEEYGAAIVKAIENCRVMVLIFSASANNSRQTRREVERAINAGVTLVPVRIEDVPPTESFAYFMSSVHWLDALTPPLEEHLQKLAASIKALLQAGVSPPPRAAGPMPAAGLVGEQRDAAMSGAAMGAEPTPGRPAMFAELMNFSYQRTKLQAFGWYLIFLLIATVYLFVAGYMVGFLFTDTATAFQFGVSLGQALIVPYQVLLGILLIWNRKKDGGNIMLLLGGIVLSVFTGALGGLIPFAFLTHRPAFSSAPASAYARR